MDLPVSFPYQHQHLCIASSNFLPSSSESLCFQGVTGPDAGITYVSGQSRCRKATLENLSILIGEDTCSYTRLASRRPETRFEHRWQQHRTRKLPSFHPSHKVQTFKRPIPATQESIYPLCTGSARRSFFLSLPIQSPSGRYRVLL